MQIQLIKNAKSKAATEKLKIDWLHCISGISFSKETLVFRREPYFVRSGNFV